MVLERRKYLAPSGIPAPDLPLGTNITVYMDCWVENEIGELNIEFVVFFRWGFSVILLKFLVG
jgi:hypothetical protein